MNWDLAIEDHRMPLLRIVASLFAAIGLGEGRTVHRLAWPLYRMVLSILRPAESAVRRLIVVAARNLMVKPPKPRSPPKGLTRSSSGNGKGRMAFRLCDPRKRLMWVYDPSPHGREPDPPLPGGERAHRRGPVGYGQPAGPDGTVNAQPLCRRLLALKQALDDLAYQARRYARWRARPVEQRRPKLASALRLGPAPGGAGSPRTKSTPSCANATIWLGKPASCAGPIRREGRFNPH